MIRIHKFNLEKYNICDEIIKIRKDLGLTQKDFGELFGIPQNNISMWENYKSTPPRYVITMIKKLLSSKQKENKLNGISKNFWNRIPNKV